MKKLLLTALVFAGVQVQAIAQDEVSTDESSNDLERREWYVGFGVTGNDGFRINSVLEEQGLPELNDAAFEITIGRSVINENVLTDLEWNTSYMDKKTSSDRIRNTNTGFKLRGHYVAWNNDKFFFSGGLDVSYTLNNFNLYSRGNRIDMEDLEPSTHTGHINLYNNQLFLGPSITLGAFQNSDFPIRLVAGYEWGVYSSDWKSEVAEVDNSFRENGQGRFYARLVLPL